MTLTREQIEEGRNAIRDGHADQIEEWFQAHGEQMLDLPEGDGLSREKILDMWAELESGRALPHAEDLRAVFSLALRAMSLPEGDPTDAAWLDGALQATEGRVEQRGPKWMGVHEGAVRRLLRIIDQLREARAEGFRAAHEWQPIETAPKDGAHFLAFWRSEFGTTAMGVCRWHEGDWCSDECDDGGDPIKVGQPTHWQPLPLPPQESK